MELFVRGIRIDWSKIEIGSYVREIPAIASLDELVFHKNITFFVGENGTGKSTLLEALAIAYGFNPEGGTRNFRFSTYNTCSDLNQGICVVKNGYSPEYSYFLRAESFYNMATKAEEYESSYMGKSLHHQSHGESFLSFIQSSANSKGFYILDEPEAALSTQRQMALLIQLYDMAKEGSQFVIVTHSPILLGVPGAEILSFSQNGIEPCDYEQTESYQVTEMFINHRQYILDKLLRDEKE